MSAPSTWRPWQHTAWRVLNASTAPVWLLMVLAPRSRVTARVVPAVMPLHAALGLTYAALLAKGAVAGGDRVDFRDGESMARACPAPRACSPAGPTT